MPSGLPSDVVRESRERHVSEANKLVVRRFVEEIWNQARLDVADELVHGQYEIDGGVGPEAVKRNVRAFRDAFPDLRYVIEQLIAEDDLVVARMTASGAHLGTFRDIYAATGRTISWLEIGMWRVEDGMLREAWFAAHELSIRRQMGVLPRDIR
jgi:predicted ester cyclase